MGLSLELMIPPPRGDPTRFVNSFCKTDREIRRGVGFFNIETAANNYIIWVTKKNPRGV